MAERAIEAVAVQQVGMRYTPKSAVQALYTGASRMNCIAMAGSLYNQVDLGEMDQLNPTTDVPVGLAAFTMVLAMREVEYRTLYGVSRNLDDFSTLLKVFETAGKAAVDTELIETNKTTEEEQTPGENAAALAAANRSSVKTTTNTKTTQTVLQRNPALERFFNVVSGCLENAAI